MKKMSLKTGFDRKTVQKFFLLSACSFGVFLSSNQTSFAQVRQDTYMNKLPFITGGFGNEEQNQINAQAEKFNLHLRFAEGAERAYIAGVKTVITDAQGNEVFKDESTGPLLYLKLDPGKYTLNLEYKGQSKSQTIELDGNKTQEHVLNW